MLSDMHKAVYDNLLGVVLNKVDMNVFGRYAAHRSDIITTNIIHAMAIRNEHKAH